ncbi:UDP-glucose 4-epimerase GalE [Amylibacter sp. SFDW26]|uniref:UDP-glucose 4-epimerase GalE n=1 Tax=Amylibacter sp. SFDW26 TaxID=2652722 RepID=UPI0012623173|nr:UDP-glucose 4-epimerase GalE [Amylibacter sp. SFDW26]KAB7610094.1 UDP-glucose 4-epimerase GalE [Amylibacter sp. SFDW26]
MRVFLTGGAGYIGSHTLLEVLSQDHEVCVYDDFSNSEPEALNRVAKLTNRSFETVEGDVLDRPKMRQALIDFRPDVVVHFAGKKAVGESTEKPLMYYRNNVEGTLSLLEGMEAAGCKRIVFSSSATVYGDPHYLPYDEAHPLAPTNPYGMTKYMVELILKDWCTAQDDNTAVLLRYFNPVGAHESGEIGEDPNDIPNNLMPFVSQVAVGRLEKLRVFGADYETPDGTGVRDYIHVVDLAKAHAAAIGFAGDHKGCEAINVGSGQGSSVLDVVRAFEGASGRNIPYDVVERRAGDIAEFYADPTKAYNLLGWKTECDLADMCGSAWKWQSQNPNGYKPN